MRVLRFVWQAIQRDWKSGELGVLGLALVVAVASVTSVGFFTDRVSKAMQLQASTLLAADLLVSSSEPIPSEIIQKADELGLLTAETREFPSVIVKDDETQLVGVKAVSEYYPLRGQLSLTDQPFGDERPAGKVPEPGNIWIDPRLVGLLDLTVGDTLQLGQREFTVSALLAFEPDRGGNMFSFAPRVMFHLGDLESTGLVTFASRVAYHFLLAGDAPQLATFSRWLEPRKGALNVSLNDVSNARPEMRVALERSQSFLGLAALVAVILSGAAVAVSAQGFSTKQATAAAVMRSFGASRHFVLLTVCLRLLVIAMFASLLGSGIGFLVQQLLTDMMSNLFVMSIPPPSLTPLLAGLLTGFITLVGFALPPVVRVRQVPVMRVLRDDLGITPPSAWIVTLAGLAAIGILMVWQANSFVLAGLVITGSVGALVALGITGFVLMLLLKRFPGSSLTGWRFGLTSLVRRSQGSTLQMAAFGLGLMALLLLSIVRVDVLNAWQRELPDDAPNVFIVNIKPEDAEHVKAYLAGLGVEMAELYPMIRGRLVAINDQPVAGEDYSSDPETERLVSREFNLSYADKPREDNPVIEGEWWRGDDRMKSLFSVEKDIAERLGVGLGDRLTFRVAGDEVSAVINNIREVQWDSFRVNFFVVGTPAAMEAYPATVITSFYLDKSRQGELAALIKTFPGITVIDVDALIQRVKGMMDRAASSVEYVFLFTLVAGIVVLLAAVQASRGERVKEAALLRALGAGRYKILQSLVAEFALLGLIAGLLGATAAGGIGWLLSDQVFHLKYDFNPSLWIVGVSAGVVGIGIAGVMATRSVLAVSPLQSLKK